MNPFTNEKIVIVDSQLQFERFYREHKNDIWVSYNGRNYDQWIAKAILCGFNPKEVNDFIIVEGHKGHEYSKQFYKFPINNFDIMPQPPVGLKTLEGFMGKSIVETSVPFNIDRELTDEEIKETIFYCEQDVMNTIEVLIHRKTEFDAQLSLIKTFNLPLSYIGKTPAQLAATILGAKKKKFKDNWNIRLPETLQLIKYQYVANWFLNPENHNEKKFLKTTVAGIPHVFAWGGLHGAISKYNYVCKKDEVFVMVDVDQLYPTLMLKYGLLSRSVNDYSKFEDILKTSLRLKAEKKKKEREPYKKICNITYGAEGDKYNSMYDPLHRTLVCAFGQLLILDLIEKIECFCELIQSNTDGILVKLKLVDLCELKKVVHDWEQRTHLHMSFDEFVMVYQKDVNNYIIVAEDGSYKAIGGYVKDLNGLDYDLPIVNEAVKNYLLNSKQVEQTIFECNDFRKFQKIVKLSNKYKWVEHEHVTGNTRYENKAYRVFASEDENDGRLLKCDGVRNPAKFANTPDNCFIWNESVIDVPIPNKLDYQWYIDLSKKRLKDFGIFV